MFEYSCFLHPQHKGASLDSRCPECNQPYGFPLEAAHLPRTINGKRVVEGLNRGFYGAVFKMQHPRTGRFYAVKVIPVQTYAPKEEGGYSKSFEREWRLHLDLSSAPVVARLEDQGENDINFGQCSIPCYWMEMEFVDGSALSQVIKSGPTSPRQAAQIAWDLLDVIEALQRRGQHHNDFHGGNIIVTRLSRAESRLSAIDPETGMKVLDLGSAAQETRSSDERLGDTHWVAKHILELLESYERTNIGADPALLRTCAQLRRVAEHYYGADKQRRPSPSDMKEMVRAAYYYAQRPFDVPVRLPSISTHYNARTLPPSFAPELLYDPSGRWAGRLQGPGPQLLFGMRGCGKTMLLRSLEWPARLRARKTSGPAYETRQEVAQRVSGETFLGVFVSCSALLRGPRPELIDRPVLRTFLAFAREIVRDVEACAFTEIGSVNYSELQGFAEVVHRAVPWFAVPSNPADVWELSRAIAQALSRAWDGDISNDLPPLLVFEELCRSTRRLVDIWANKVLLFLLDDVSTRVLPVQNVSELLSQLCIHSPLFGFKVSTENQTLELRTEGGEVAREGRDFEPFDLGLEVVAHLGGHEGAKFIASILQRRAAITEGAPRNPVKEILGSQSLETLAGNLRSGLADPVYWGLESLAGMCVGDIGDVLQLYETILQRGAEKPFPISSAIQHKAAIEIAEVKLRALAIREEWLYSHAVAFAQASHRELRRSSSRLRQHTRIHVNITEQDAPTLFPLLLKMVDAGVFVFIGGQSRSKAGGGQSRLQFKLAYRKMLGLPYRMPLSDRDRFEPENPKELRDWIEHPAAERLRWGKLPEEDRGSDGQTENGRQSLSHEAEQQIMQDIPKSPQPRGENGELPEAHTLFSVQTMLASEISAARVSLEDKHVIAAFGFEDRSPGSWRNLLAFGCPRRATLVQYPNEGKKKEIEAVLRDRGVSYDITLTGSYGHGDLVRQLIGSCDAAEAVLIDTTSLTKALIYELVTLALVERGDVWVLHTCADEYFPPGDELRRVVDKLLIPA
jgi:serine/threonine protein kinase